MEEERTPAALDPIIDSLGPQAAEPARPADADTERHPGAWRALLRELDVRPSKGLGQNFLTDRGVVRRIADTATLAPGETVVEIGPGLGILTAELLARVGPAGRVVAVEYDRRLAAHLRERRDAGGFAAADGTDLGPSLAIVEADALRRPPETLAPDGAPYALVANLPYNITSAVLRHFLDSPRRPTRLVVMVQREVAERIVARPPAMSVLAVAVQFYGAASLALRVSRGAFLPQPKVDSAVVRVLLHPRPPLPEAEIAPFFRVVGAGFGQRRKQLLNSLAAGLDQPKPTLQAALAAAGIAPDRRAETLTVDEWLRLYRQLGAAPAAPAADRP